MLQAVYNENKFHDIPRNLFNEISRNSAKNKISRNWFWKRNEISFRKSDKKLFGENPTQKISFDFVKLNYVLTYCIQMHFHDFNLR